MIQPSRLDWFFLTDKQNQSRRFGQQVKNRILIILEMGIRRGRHDAKFRDATFADLSLLPIRVDLETDRHAWGQYHQNGARHRLTLYGDAYLELARRRAFLWPASIPTCGKQLNSNEFPCWAHNLRQAC